jgi:hypothetical protein
MKAAAVLPYNNLQHKRVVRFKYIDQFNEFKFLEWHEERNCRLTKNNFRNICKMKTYTANIVKDILYSNSSNAL